MTSGNRKATFGALVCGDFSRTECELQKILGHLERSISNVGDRCILFLSEGKNDDLVSYGPFSARNLLETACTAFIGRLDPFRLISIKRFQEHPKYDVSQRSKISLKWRDGVVPEDKAPDNRWATDGALKTSARALLSDYWGDVFWTPAFSALLDYPEDSPSSLNNLRTIEPDNVVKYFRSEADKLFSSLSKGIHTEFVIPLESVYDEATVKNLLERTCILVMSMLMSAVVHSMPTALFSITLEQAYAQIRELESRMGLQ